MSRNIFAIPKSRPTVSNDKRSWLKRLVRWAGWLIGIILGLITLIGVLLVGLYWGGEPWVRFWEEPSELFVVWRAGIYLALFLVWPAAVYRAADQKPGQITDINVRKTIQSRIRLRFLIVPGMALADLVFWSPWGIGS